MRITATVDVRGAHVVVNLRYENRADDPEFILRGAWGVDREQWRTVDGAEDEFFIAELRRGGKVLTFDGVAPKRTVRWSRGDFTELAPGEVLHASIRIGLLTIGSQAGRYLYGFLPGERRYELSRRHVVLDERSGRVRSVYSEPVQFTFEPPQIWAGDAG